jgi:hypothetical protein
MKRRNRSMVMFVFMVSLISFVIAGSGDIDLVGDNINYSAFEDILYNHSLMQNITGTGDDISFNIFTDATNKIYWNGAQVSQSQISPFIFISNETIVDLIINSTNDSTTGFFEIPIRVSWTNVSTGSHTTGSVFEFMVNATNDYPNFTLQANYNASIQTTGNYSKNISLVGSDEEEHYPLTYNFSINDCSFAQWSTRTNADCSLNNMIYNLTDSNSVLEFSNLTYNDVGVYNLTICAKDFVDLGNLPAYYVSSYTSNKTTCYNTTLNLFSSLSINITDCDGTNWTEGDTLNCNVNITTAGSNDDINITTEARFENDAGAVYNSSWFYSERSVSATDFSFLATISVPLTKREVGDWIINFSVDDGSETEPRPLFEEINIFVNFTESPVDLISISDLTGGNALYESENFQANVSDEDLLIWDDSVKKETFVLASNVSWVDVSVTNSGDSVVPYRMASVFVNHTEIIDTLGEGTYAVRINVSDGGGNTDYEDFLVEAFNDSAPEWSPLLDDPVNLLLTEDSLFFYNFSMNVSDVDGDPISFYFEDVNGVFCSLNSTNFDSGGFVNFTPTDCDVGYQNITVIATDGKLNSSHEFNFTVLNVLDIPIISSLSSNVVATEGVEEAIYWNI